MDDAAPFSAFRRSIHSEALATVADHWNHVRGGQPAPTWKDIDPVTLSKHLAIVWSWRWDDALDDFVGRLAGTQLEQLVEHSIRGRSFTEIFGATAPSLHKAFRDAMETPALLRWTGKVYGFAGRHGGGERIILPLGPDAKGRGGVFGGTIYCLEEGCCSAALRTLYGTETRQRFPILEATFAAA